MNEHTSLLQRNATQRNTIQKKLNVYEYVVCSAPKITFSLSSLEISMRINNIVHTLRTIIYFMFARICVWIDTCLFIWFPRYCAAVCERDHYIILEVPFLDTVHFRRRKKEKGFIFSFCCSCCCSMYIECIQKVCSGIFIIVYI